MLIFLIILTVINSIALIFIASSINDGFSKIFTEIELIKKFHNASHEQLKKAIKEKKPSFTITTHE